MIYLGTPLLFSLSIWSLEVISENYINIGISPSFKDTGCSIAISCSTYWLAWIWSFTLGRTRICHRYHRISRSAVTICRPSRRHYHWTRSTDARLTDERRAQKRWERRSKVHTILVAYSCKVTRACNILFLSTTQHLVGFTLEGTLGALLEIAIASKEFDECRPVTLHNPAENEGNGKAS